MDVFIMTYQEHASFDKLKYRQKNSLFSKIKWVIVEKWQKLEEYLLDTLCAQQFCRMLTYCRPNIKIYKTTLVKKL